MSSIPLKLKKNPSAQVLEQLVELLKRRTIDSPAYGLEPPNINAMLDNLSWAIRHPHSFTEAYLINLRTQIEDAEYCLSLMRTVMSARMPGSKKTILENLMAKRRRR